MRGEAAAAGESLLQVADLSRMWLELSVPESALSLLQVGLPVSARSMLISHQGLAYLGEAYGLSVLGIERDGRCFLPDPSIELHDGDILIASGRPLDIDG